MCQAVVCRFTENHVRCWFALEDLKWRERIRTGIDDAIRFHDKLLLVLFPVRVDKAFFESPFVWATEIRHERNIGDFTRWKNHNDYDKAFTRLLCDLKAATEQAELGFG